MSKMIRHIFILFLCLLMTEADLFAQNKNKRRPTATSAHRGRFKSIKVSRAKARVVCPVFEDSQYPYQGIGVKVGDPFAVTYKFYPHENFAIALDGGKAASGLYSGYHRENFQDLTQPDTLGFDQGIGYLGHVVKKEWVFEGKMLYQRDASKVLKGLQWYVGAGWQWRNTKIQYEYLLEISFDENEINLLDNSYLTMGPVAVLGIEYSYFTIPVAAFMEIEWYTDVVQDPGWQRFQGGVGLRVVF
jgi:hypothetical protein